MRRVLGILLAVLAITVAGCEEEPTPGGVLEQYAADVATVAYNDFTDSTAVLLTQVGDLCAGARDANAALDALDIARQDWMLLQAMLTGPAMERRSPAVVDWPVSIADIEALVERSNPGEITPDVMANTSVPTHVASRRCAGCSLATMRLNCSTIRGGATT